MFFVSRTKTICILFCFVSPVITAVQSGGRFHDENSAPKVSSPIRPSAHNSPTTYPFIVSFDWNVFSWLFPSVFELLCLYHNFNFFLVCIFARGKVFHFFGGRCLLYVAFRRDIGSTSTASCGLPPYRKNVV